MNERTSTNHNHDQTGPVSCITLTDCMSVKVVKLYLSSYVNVQTINNRGGTIKEKLAPRYYSPYPSYWKVDRQWSRVSAKLPPKTVRPHGNVGTVSYIYMNTWFLGGMYFVERSIHLIEELWLLIITGVQASFVYCDSAVSYGPKLWDHTHYRWSCVMSVVLQFRTIRNGTVAMNDRWLLLKPEHLLLYIYIYIYIGGSLVAFEAESCFAAKVISRITQPHYTASKVSRIHLSSS